MGAAGVQAGTAGVVSPAAPAVPSPPWASCMSTATRVAQMRVWHELPSIHCKHKGPECGCGLPLPWLSTCWPFPWHASAHVAAAACVPLVHVRHGHMLSLPAQSFLFFFSQGALPAPAPPPLLAPTPPPCIIVPAHTASPHTPCCAKHAQTMKSVDAMGTAMMGATKVGWRASYVGV